jgi:hypothetical protein
MVFFLNGHHGCKSSFAAGGSRCHAWHRCDSYHGSFCVKLCCRFVDADSTALWAQLVVVPTIGAYKDLPPGEYRTAGIGGLFFDGAEKKCMEALDKNGVKKRLCADEVMDHMPSKVVPVEKSDCSEEGNVDGNCGGLTWQTFLKQNSVQQSLAQANNQKFIKFFEVLGRDSHQGVLPGAKNHRSISSAVASKPTKISAASVKQLYQVSFQQAMKAQHMYDQASNDGDYQGPGAKGHFGRNLRQPQISPAAMPRTRALPPGARREGDYTRTGAGMRALHRGSALARAPASRKQPAV